MWLAGPRYHRPLGLWPATGNQLSPSLSQTTICLVCVVVTLHAGHKPEGLQEQKGYLLERGELFTFTITVSLYFTMPILIRDAINKNFNISVEIDPLLLNQLDCDNKIDVHRTISINLYSLIYYIGLIQTRRIAPTTRQKFTDKADLIDHLYLDSLDFRVQIARIQRRLGPEVLGSVSEDFGVGVSIVIARNLFNVSLSTIEKIVATRKRADWRCQTTDNRLLVVESKGASSPQTRRTQGTNANTQKRTNQNADLRIASLTLIREDFISINRFLDPPAENENMDSERENRILKAGHYEAIFNFLGQPKLSKYFSQMRKRLSNSITPVEQNEKNKTFEQMRDRYSRVSFRQKLYIGTFYEIEEGNFLFIGVDNELISYEGFYEFREYQTQIDEEIFDNHYLLYPDGVLIIEIKNIGYFIDDVNFHYKNYQENNTLTDIDNMSEISFQRYIVYVLRRAGFDVRQEILSSEMRVDIVAQFENRRFFFELKLNRHPISSLRPLILLQRISNLNERDRVVLITNVDLSQIINFRENIILIDRKGLKAILKDPFIIRELLLSSGQRQ